MVTAICYIYEFHCEQRQFPALSSSATTDQVSILVLGAGAIQDQVQGLEFDRYRCAAIFRAFPLEQTKYNHPGPTNLLGGPKCT